MSRTKFSDATIPPSILVRVPREFGVGVGEIGLYVGGDLPEQVGVAVEAYGLDHNVLRIFSTNARWLWRATSKLKRYQIDASNIGANPPPA